MTTSAPVITIDGPSGTGKGTVALWLKRQLGWHLLDSGSLYRVLGLAATRQNVSFENVTELADLARSLSLEFGESEGGVRVILDASDVTDAIRTEECGAAASQVAAVPEVREALLQRQHDFLRAPGLVADGRDMGTVVFPAAPLKIFLTASAEERARRRYKQLIEKGMGVNLARLLEDITERDERDRQRAVSPLKPAADAIVLDTTHASVCDVEDEVKRLAAERGLWPN